MAQIISLKTVLNPRGNITVIEKEIPFQIKRIFYLYEMDQTTRGNHRHRVTRQALICARGRCSVRIQTSTSKALFELDQPDKCLLVEPSDWHEISGFSPDALLMVLASEYFDADDYINEPYP